MAKAGPPSLSWAHRKCLEVLLQPAPSSLPPRLVPSEGQEESLFPPGIPRQGFLRITKVIQNLRWKMPQQPLWKDFGVFIFPSTNFLRPRAMPQVASESRAWQTSGNEKSNANKTLPLVLISWIFPTKGGDSPSWR